MNGVAAQARYLRNAAPQAFAEFCKAFEAYKNEQILTLLLATDNITLAQGHAQQCVKIAKMLEEVRNAG
jgi:hypothetical protein